MGYFFTGGNTATIYPAPSWETSPVGWRLFSCPGRTRLSWQLTSMSGGQSPPRHWETSWVGGGPPLTGLRTALSQITIIIMVIYGEPYLTIKGLSARVTESNTKIDDDIYSLSFHSCRCCAQNNLIFSCTDADINISNSKHHITARRHRS